MAESFFLPDSAPSSSGVDPMGNPIGGWRPQQATLDQFQGSEDMPAMQLPEDPQMRAAAQVKALRAPTDTQGPAAPTAQAMPTDPEVQSAMQQGTDMTGKLAGQLDAQVADMYGNLKNIGK